LFLEERSSDGRVGGHDQAELRAVDAGSPGALVADGDAVVVDVHVLAEVVDVRGLPVDGEVVLGNLLDVAVGGLALDDDAGGSSRDGTSCGAAGGGLVTGGRTRAGRNVRGA
jgi:hypothetical protein